MAKRKRVLQIPYKVESGGVLSGRCSVCHRPFEVSAKPTDAPGSAIQELNALFDDHTCDEDFSQAAARIVKETTQNNRE